ncbi:hypothetical protein [Nocardia sp. NPDC024068]|uniref:hypothetical protein n=1 Tax=Nocardia sp. NPDC024068 TaxID=3157197 RepID=UPI0033F13A21
MLLAPALEGMLRLPTMSRIASNRWLRYQENRDLVDQAFSYVTRIGKEAIRQNDKVAVGTLESLATLLLAAYVESRLNETIWYYSGFDDSQRQTLADLTIEERWYKVIDLGFARLRNLTVRQVPNNLNFTDKARREELVRVVSDYISPLITARNSIAHGQWKYAFNPDGSAINGERTAIISRYTIWRVTLEKNLLDHFTWIVHDLVVTGHTYERDFDKRIDDLHSAVNRLKKGDRNKWEEGLRARYRRRPQVQSGI